jgi:transcriptional regulator with XRE-family HTH domain
MTGVSNLGMVPNIFGSLGVIMLTTGYQLAAARALIGMDQTTLAELANVSANTIRNMEASKNGPISGRTQSVEAVQAALEAKGVDFLNHGQPGVRLRSGADSAGSILVENLTSENDE